MAAAVVEGEIWNQNGIKLRIQSNLFYGLSALLSSRQSSVDGE